METTMEKASLSYKSYKVAKDENMQAAYEYVCKFKENSYHNNSTWNLRFNWLEITAQIQKKIFQILIILRYYVVLGFRAYILMLVWIGNWSVRAKTRNCLRKAIKATEKILSNLELKKLSKENIVISAKNDEKMNIINEDLKKITKTH